MSEQMFGRPAVNARSQSSADLSSGQLHDLPIFAGLRREVVDGLLERSCSRTYPSGALILKQGEPARSLNIVRRGIVDLTHLSGKSECGVLLLSARDLLLPATTLCHEPALVSARALTNTRMLEIEGEAIETALAEYPVFAANLIKAMSGHWRMAVRNILDLNCRTAAQRVGASCCGSPTCSRTARHRCFRLPSATSPCAWE
jgi:CRP-like cAMP-binding protein